MNGPIRSAEEQAIEAAMQRGKLAVRRRGPGAYESFEALTRCRKCGHPWGVHRDPDSLDLCQGITESSNGVCRCDRIRPATTAEYEESFGDPNYV